MQWYNQPMWSRHHHSYKDYLDIEYMSQIKHEYIDGEVIAMTGGSPDHAAIGINISTALNVQLRGKPCRVYSSDLKIRIDAANVATYPDVSVVCGQPELDPIDRKGHTILNPIVVVEVLSPSTAGYDCNEKLDYYKQIPSLREIVHVDFAQKRIMVWRKGFGDQWRPEETTAGDATLTSIDCVLSIAEVYRDPFAAS